MKYIRTKDGIIDLSKYDIIRDAKYYDQIKYILKSKKHRKNGQDYTKVSKEAIIKESDNLKELCDEFIVDCKLNIKHKPFIYTLPKDIKEYYTLLEMTKKDTIIYGAIWIKGNNDEPILKPVSKMNDEGELELL